ncbi:MAG: AMP-binding protein [Anaerovoracaceae bacterium]
MNKLPIEFQKPHYSDFKDFFADIATRYSGKEAFILKKKVKKEITYTSVSYDQFCLDVKAVATALLNLGYENKKIAIIGDNSYNWLLAYYATLAGVGIVIPLDKGLTFEETLSSITRSEADILFFDDGHLETAKKIQDEHSTTVNLFVNLNSSTDFIELETIKSQGLELINNGSTAYDEKVIDKDEVTILLFTSGTTSMSKIVALTQQNILSNLYALQSSEFIFEGERSLALLPLHHTFGSTGTLLMLASGVSTAFCDGLKYINKNLIEYKISVFFCVPLLIESIYKKIMTKVKKEGKEKTFNTMIKLTRFLLKFKIDIRRKVFASIHEQLGGHLRLLITGASAIDKKALECFLDLGIVAVQGYGLTETSPVVSAENNNNIRIGSVGKAMCNVDIKINEPNSEGIGDVFVKGPNVMVGYYQNQEETDKVFVDGWFNTGDLGYIDKDGFLFLSGRSKNVVVLKNGKNVYPEEIELLISSLPYVAENFVFGMPKADDETDLILGVKIVYNGEYIKTTYGDISTEDLEKIIKNDIDKINETMPHYKNLIRVIITDEPMIKTSTAKVKRHEEIELIKRHFK